MTERGVNPEQYKVLMSPLRGARIAKRRQSGKDLSYLESWDVRAHMNRIFGFGNWDAEVIEQYQMSVREYRTDADKDMAECIWYARVAMTVRDEYGQPLCSYVEGAVGSNSGPATMIAESHDNACKTAASDAFKRCAINLGSQFGLSLYDSGSVREVVRSTIIKPEGSVTEPDGPTDEQRANLAHSLGATEVEQPDDSGSTSNDDPVPDAAGHDQEDRSVPAG